MVKREKEGHKRRVITIGALFCSLIYFSASLAAPVNLEILNKVSAKKTPLQIEAGTTVVVHDMRIITGKCYTHLDSFEGAIYHLPVRIWLDQDSEEPVELYAGELVSSPRYPSKPIEHSLYDIILVKCD